MLKTVQNGYAEESETYGEQMFSETPFVESPLHELEEPSRESSVLSETYAGNWEFTTPFLTGESTEAGESEATAPEVAAFSEITAELKDTLFREALEQLADEALEAHSDQLAGEYGDRETRDLAGERLLNEHFEPLAVQTEAMIDRFFERLEGYNAESLTDMEIGRISDEVLSTEVPMSPASEQFLGAFGRKLGRVVSGAAKLAGKVANLPLRFLLAPLKKVGRIILQKVVRFALNKLPLKLRPLAQRLSERLFHTVGQTHESEFEAQEQTEAEVLPATPDAAHLEAEFDVQVAQLLFTPDEAEIDHLVSNYGESENYSSPLPVLDTARSELIKELSRLQPGESAQPVMEQFLPAIYAALKAAIAVIGRTRVVDFLGKQLARLIQPLIGADFARQLGPPIANVGMRLFGFETNPADPRGMAAEALAATIEETVNTIAEMPPHVLENETLLSEAVNEAFENAAASYFPNSMIKPELRESAEPHGMWHRMPLESSQKRYAKYNDTFPVEISPRVASTIKTFGGATLHDHLRDQHDLQNGHYKGKVSLYKVLPGANASTIARAEKIPASSLHPLTPHAAGALLGKNAGLGRHPTPGAYLANPQKLHVNQRLYRIEPPTGRRHHHVRRIHSELLINLLRGEVRLWLYLNEPLCQRISSDLAKGGNASLAFKHLKSLLLRATEALKLAAVHRHLPPEILVVSEAPNLDGRVQHWLRLASGQLGAKIAEWAQVQVAQYLRNSAEDFKRACASHHDGVTLRITMTRVPGLDALRLLSQGKMSKELSQTGWPKGSPAFQVIAHSGYAINRLQY